MMTKKGVGAIVATALLLVVAVVGVVTFQTWFNTYSSSLQNEVESQSSTSLNTRIDRVIGDTLYFRNGDSKNLSINKVEIEGQDCNVFQNISSGTQSIDISSCISNLTTSTPEVVVYTDDSIYSEKIFVDSSSSNSGSGNSFSLDCNSLPGEWSAVPGNDDLNTSDFCMMTYEAKATTATESNLYDSINMYCGDGSDGGGNNCPTDGSVNVTSKPESLPLTQVYQKEARILCSNLGSGYQLITDSQWVTMARNTENIGANWNSSIVGQGSMWRGHSDNNPSNALSVSNTSNYYDQTGNSYPSIERRVLELSTGDVVWDVSGNVWDWTNDTTTDAELGTVGDSWYEWTSISGYNYLESSNSTFDSTNGVGRVYTSTNSNPRAFQRGGRWLANIDAGVFSLSLGPSTESSGPGIGFHCSYTN